MCIYVNKRSKFSIHTLYSGSSNSAVLLFIVELHASIVTPFPQKFFTFNFCIVLYFSFSQEAFHFRHVVSLFYVNRNTCKCVINSIIYVKNDNFLWLRALRCFQEHYHDVGLINKLKCYRWIKFIEINKHIPTYIKIAKDHMITQLR